MFKKLLELFDNLYNSQKVESISFIWVVGIGLHPYLSCRGARFRTLRLAWGHFCLIHLFLMLDKTRIEDLLSLFLVFAHLFQRMIEVERHLLAPLQVLLVYGFACLLGRLGAKRSFPSQYPSDGMLLALSKVCLHLWSTHQLNHRTLALCHQLPACRLRPRQAPRYTFWWGYNLQ